MDGWSFVKEESIFRLRKHLEEKVLKLTIPVHGPIERSTLSHLLKQARLVVDRFLELV
ncbi:MAG: hypothetical protein ACODAD_07580 [Planctomycetota bacterium]